MAQQVETNQSSIDAFILEVIEQDRAKLLDLTSRNPLISFRHSDRSRSHIRIIGEIPERLFNRLISGRELAFKPLPDPELIPPMEEASIFVNLLKKAKLEDGAYKEELGQLGPNASERQKQRIERGLRNRVRAKLGIPAFQPTWDPAKRARELGLNPDPELPPMGEEVARAGSKLQTLFFGDDLDRKLGGLRNAARVLEKDAGFSALYCAFGFLEYYESEQSEEKRVAPLVFVPVALDRVLAEQRYSYTLKSRNEDVEINVAVAELLKDLAVKLPAWEEDENDEFPLGTYLKRVEMAISGKHDWRVRRYVTVGLFTFSTLAMYKDLDPQRWPDGAPIEGRPVLRDLIAGVETSDIKYAEDYEIESLQGPEPLLITDADSSQHSAVVDVLRNNASQVIQGPPGTGKSQTITNIIAAALNEGLSVLFVAEKMAALEVVKKRLDSAGLEVFCLELHSSKTSKTAVTESLGKRMEYRAPLLKSHVVQSNADALSAARADLLRYVERVNHPAGTTGLKVCDVLLGSAIRDGFRDVLPAAIADARLGNPLAVSPHAYPQMLAAAATLEKQMQPLAMFGTLADHPWRGVQNIEITELDENRLITLLSEWNAAIRNILDRSSSLATRLHSTLPVTPILLERFCLGLTSMRLPPESLIEDTYQACLKNANRASLRSAIQLFQKLLISEARLSECVSDRASAREVGSSFVNGSLLSLRELGIAKFSVGSLVELAAEQEQSANQLARLAPLCMALTDAVGLHNPDITSLRAAIAAIDLLGTLPRPLWTMRSRSVLDEAHRAAVERASKQASGLKQEGTDLKAEFDLEVSPSYGELRTYGTTLRSASVFSALLSSRCREARRVFRSMYRGPRKKARREMADGMLRCAQYVASIEALAADSTLKSVCGPHYSGVETPFAELLRVSNWGTDVRQRLASFGETGIAVREFLFGATVDELDKVQAIGSQTDLPLLSTTVGKFPDGDDTLWNDVVQHERERSDALAIVVDWFQRTSLRHDCTESEVAATCDALAAIEKCEAGISSNSAALCLVGGSVDALRRDLDTITLTLEFAESLAQVPLPAGLLEFLFGDSARISEVQCAAREIVDGCASLRFCATEANKVGQIDSTLWCGAETIDGAPLQRLLERNTRAVQHVSALRDYLTFLLAEDAACDYGIGPVLAAYSTSGIDYHNLTRAVEFVFFRSAAEAILKNDPELRRHSGATHQELRHQFQALDREYLELRRTELISKLTQRPCPNGNSFGPVSDLSELALVRRVAGQTRPRISVRDLMLRAGGAIQALKPCWMMSPMSVAQYLEPGKLSFDLVIMDEASQIRREEALGAIARSKKAVIVGDQWQLPPSPFFQRLSQGDLADDDEFEETKQDSVLEAAAGRFYPCRRLKWHYRSEHGSLIQFSNHEFYDDQLTVFPSPHYDHPEYGVSLEQTCGTYDSGLNEIEGKEVVAAAIKFMRGYPAQSLGIVAVNAKQAEFIREQLDRECANDESAAAYVQKWEPTLESVFVKNLENVQGDERDVIFISTVYGKNREGKFYQRFGPINGIYGHRRLNVLFTRAKKKVTVFTSMIPEEIEEEGKQWGVKVLKGYLQFARDGFVAIPTEQGECESEFEEWVLQVLRAHGYQAVPQVGVCGYRIDIAVRHPEKPSTYLCGVECDGATYHSARSVRERDRLRQEILEKYGWKLYRIWSTDWFRNPNLQTNRLLTYLQQLQTPSAASSESSGLLSTPPLF
jgi:very-short-patch-repair endonuclease